MRLINTKTFQLETFDNWENVPPYAILSHTWEQEEVLFCDITADVEKKKRGWAKILGASVEAEKLGLFYLWVDTCCINKESSAELSQSINSMFAWYRDARICFAYLGDLNADKLGDFDKSRWWTRGWTLQELIAPDEVMFFAQDWTFVGLRSSSSRRIAEITGIGEVILAGGQLHKLHDFSVAEKFFWAAERMTTCGEDRAYSLMGIFGVNMAMIYGEGEQAACYRLQKEIFGVYADHSIFAWDFPSGVSRPRLKYGLFAPTISAFRYSCDIISEPYNWDVIGLPKESKPKAGSNKNKQLATFSAFSHGIRVQILLENQGNGVFLAYLACRRRSEEHACFGVYLNRNKRSGNYQRSVVIGPGSTVKIDSYTGNKTTLEDIYIGQPRGDFDHHFVQYQLGGLSDAPDPEFLLHIDDDWAREAGFTSVTHLPVAQTWKYIDDQPQNQARPQLELWKTGQNHDSMVTYYDEKADENFVILMRSCDENRIYPPRSISFFVVFLSNVGPLPFSSDAESVRNYMALCENDYSTDLSQSMIIKLLPSGRQVILGVNTFTSGTSQNFRMTVVVKESRI